MIPIFVGYDHREPVAYHACVNSIIRHTTEPVSITPLALKNFRKFYKERHTDGSNQFIYSRFLVPFLMGFSGHAIYLDGDMILRGDIVELWQQRSHWHAAQVIKHDYKTVAGTKYLGNKNEDYPRKNWSSVILWNCGHYHNRCLLPDYVETKTGAHLHRFEWIEDERLGEIEKEWNWLAVEYDYNPKAKLIHYTLGTPCFEEYKDTEMSIYWHQEHRLLNEPCRNPSTT